MKYERKDMRPVIEEFLSKVPQHMTCSTELIVSRIANIELHLPFVPKDYKDFLHCFARYLQEHGAAVTADQFIAVYQKSLDDYWLHSKNLHPDKDEILQKLFFIAHHTVPSKMHLAVWEAYARTLRWK